MVFGKDSTKPRRTGCITPILTVFKEQLGMPWPEGQPAPNKGIIHTKKTMKKILTGLLP